MSTIREAVLLAAETLEENPERWLQGDLFEHPDDEGLGAFSAVRACALGMCYVAHQALVGPAVGLACTLNFAHDDAYGVELTDFNDNKATSAAEVAARLRELAERL